MEFMQKTVGFATRRFPCPGMMVAVLGMASAAGAQCTLQVIGSAAPGVTGGSPTRVSAYGTWDPDGAGPQPAWTVVAGKFTSAGGVPAANIAAFDPAAGQWRALGSGCNGEVTAVCTLPNGELAVGGAFTSAGGVPASCIARWNGSTWSGLGTGMTGLNTYVASLAIASNGDLLAGGYFQSAGGVPARDVARWNGAAWTSFAGGTSGFGFGVWSVLGMPNGDVIIGGQFGTVGSVAANCVARWNGTTWSPMGSGLDDGVFSMALGANGDVYATNNHVYRWNGSAWTLDAQGGSTLIRSCSVDAAGALFIAGSVNGLPGAVCRRQLGTWSALPGIPSAAVVYCPPAGGLLAGGDFTTFGGFGYGGVALWNGTVWSPLGSGSSSGPVSCFAEDADGTVYVGGRFAQLGAPGTSNVARWRKGNWESLAGGVGGGALYPVGVRALLTRANGDVIAGGYFTQAGGVAVNSIARWDGTSWGAMGNPSPSGVLLIFSLAEGPNGSLFAAGGGLTEWDGSAWSFIPQSSGADRLCQLASGELVVAGSFTAIGGIFANRIAQWDGNSWSPLGAGFDDTVLCVTATPDGALYAGGWFSSAGGAPASRVARWNGSTWTALGAGLNGNVTGLAVLPNGDVVAVGFFSFGGGLARWNGTTWSALGTGTGSGPASALFTGAGDLWLGGTFTMVNGVGAANLARLRSSCAPAAAPNSDGCSGSAGPLVLNATQWPLLGTEVRTRTRDLAPGSLAVAVYGTSQITIPMASVHPLGLPGCTLTVTDDILLEMSLAAGIVDARISVPVHPALLGAVFHHQVVAVETGASGAILALASSNSMTFAIGTF